MKMVLGPQKDFSSMCFAGTYLKVCFKYVGIPLLTHPLGTPNPYCALTLTLQRNFYLCIPRKELRGLSPNFHMHVSVSDLYIPQIGPHIWLQQKRQTDTGNI
jgi:hypothetical protein